MPPVWDTLLRAALLARRSEASEIGLDEATSRFGTRVHPERICPARIGSDVPPDTAPGFSISSAAAKRNRVRWRSQTMPVGAPPNPRF